ncbi:glycosyltransferase family 2 protein [Acidianus sp. RZ1]|uniref:glycosyltransferase family 2 protein n=1 Tax=Acidianus sp. RZ1 TaxID=1540082 RepID=UPI0014916327|nr:glycosyltransferase family 2 protein [Acidianus sp. RZ1]NON62881.1 glycosyltransferase family 2 protein [Acidianus sp. RZ1]
MLISVLVTAYKRKEYLKQAVDSVLSQGDDDSEIIVVKDFPELDDYLMEKGIKSIRCERKEQGLRVYMGLLKVEGEIVVFLDDDDMFLPGKLKAVRDAFARGVDFYHNEFKLIDQNGNEIKRPNNRRLSRISGREEVLIMSKKEALRKLGSLHPIAVNSSSIAVSTNVLLEASEYLRKVTRNIDGFFLYSALRSEKPLAIDLRELTAYRIHALNSSITLARDFQSFLTERGEYLLLMENNWHIFQDMLKGNWAEDYASFYLEATKCLRRSMGFGETRLSECLGLVFNKYFRGYGDPWKIFLLTNVFPKFVRLYLWRIYWKLKVRE